MLSGEYTHSIDSKGRLIVPAKLREQLGEQFVVTVGFDSCLFVFQKTEWEMFERQLRSLDLFNADAREINRVFAGSAQECTPDKMGRILLPAGLRDYAGLKKDVVLVGVLNRVEIWDGEAWNARNSNNRKNMDDIAARLQNLGVSLQQG